MMAVKIEQFMCRSDNFGVLVHDPASGQTASIDAPDGDAVVAAAQRRGWQLTHLLITHHHSDHTDGIPTLKALGAEVIGPAAEAHRIDGLDRTVRGGDAFELCSTRVEVIDTPGHTAGQIAFHMPDEALVFTADALFSLGCGRLFEGTADEMHASLQRLARLPPETSIYCGHEYTQSNARFALTVDPDNAALRERAEQVERLREAGEPTLPVRLADELAQNPFLRAHDPAIRRTLEMEEASDAAVFAELRRRKDRA